MFGNKKENKEKYILYYSIFAFPFRCFFMKTFDKKEELEKFCNENPTYSFEKFYKGKELSLKIEE